MQPRRNSPIPLRVLPVHLLIVVDRAVGKYGVELPLGRELVDPRRRLARPDALPEALAESLLTILPQRPSGAVVDVRLADAQSADLVGV